MDNNWRGKLKSKKGWVALLVLSIVFSIIFYIALLESVILEEGVSTCVVFLVLTSVGIISSVVNMVRVGEHNKKIEDEYKKSIMTCSVLKPETGEFTENECTAKKNGGAQTSSADEIRKYKELLDEGVITQEEFDAKKKQLLGI